MEAASAALVSRVMLVGHNKDGERSRPGRNHPWEAAEYDHDSRYCDFKANPELIETSLEDFAPFASERAVQQFF
jgi:hypothetical protein